MDSLTVEEATPFAIAQLEDRVRIGKESQETLNQING